MEKFISLKNVSKHYKNNIVLDNINFEFERGKRYAIVGENGSGKSVLLKLITGYIKSTSGEVCYNGKILRKDIDFIKEAGIIINAPQFISNLSGLDNLLYLAEIRNIIDKERVCNVLAELDLTDAMNKKVKTYSQGMKQRLRLAQAIMEYPEILILDEPMNAIDRRGSEKIRDLLNRINLKGVTLIFTSHYNEDVDLMADHVLEICNRSLQVLTDRGK